MPWVGFEPMLPVSERAKTLHALGRSATVTGYRDHYLSIKQCKMKKKGHFNVTLANTRNQKIWSPLNPRSLVIFQRLRTHSVQRWAMGCKTVRPGFDFWQRQENFLFSTVSRPDLGPTQPPIQWVLGFFPRGKAAEAWSRPRTSI
jgi:hypothetical protein